MSKSILTAHTAYGTFTRQTDRPYTSVLVFVPAAGLGEPEAVSWHLTAGAAHKAQIRQAHLDNALNRTPGQYAVCAIEHPAVEEGSPAAALKAELAAERTIQPASPEAETFEASLDGPVVEPEATPAVVPGEVLTREEAVALVGTDWLVRQVGKSFTHQVKLDRKDDTLARTLCGVPVHGAAQNWLAIQPVDGLTCPTCQKASAKLAKALCPDHGTDRKATCLGCHKS